MTTITKEWLQQTIAEFENTRDDIPFGLSDDDAKILIVLKQALASLDAEPVGYFYADKPGDWYQISDGDMVPDHRRIPLYSSPQPAQVVKLPNEFISNEGIVVQIEKVMAVLAVHGIQYKRRGNACRAAMLQAGNHTEQHLDMVDHSGDANEKGSDGTFIDEGTKQAGNSPVIPDGWIICSERMPDREYVLAGDFSGTHYLASIPNVQVGIYADWFDDEKPCWDDGDGNDLHLKEVTHWMPLPAAPKQEVK
ncbi:DUF551 domain-containing protein [Salmonella enterica subsp. diarizonae]|nr:DUF551 domain-containing protein [Salmonella enterica subsp. diarizonae]